MMLLYNHINNIFNIFKDPQYFFTSKNNYSEKCCMKAIFLRWAQATFYVRLHQTAYHKGTVRWLAVVTKILVVKI